jgi:hypothetical protein
MNKDTLTGLLFLSPLFAGFAILLAALYFRSRYNKAHPERERTLAQRLRSKAFGVMAYALVFIGCGYVLLQQNRYAPSWGVMFFVGVAALLIGEGLGQLNAARQLEQQNPGEQAASV